MSGSGRGPVPGWWLALVMVTVTAAALLGAAPAEAQRSTGWRFVGGVAYEHGGPGSTLVAGLDSLGFGGTVNGVDYPFNVDAGLSVALMLGVGYHSDTPTFVQVLVSNGPRGHVQGYNGPRRTRVVVTYASVAVTGVVGAHVGPFRLQVGPVMSAGRWEGQRNSVLTGKGRVVSWGWTAGASVDRAIGETVFSLTGGVRSFPALEVRETIRLGLRGDYRSMFIGVTVAPR